MCSFEAEDLESSLSEPDDERVVIPFEVGCLALMTSSAGTSWKTVKVLEVMRAAKQMVCLQEYPIQMKAQKKGYSDMNGVSEKLGRCFVGQNQKSNGLFPSREN